MGPQEWAIVILVVGARLLFPLAIPYYPLIGVLICLVLDSADQSIFQQFPAIPLDGYQSYDKALDIYYLTITYLATFRNWTNEFAFKTSLFLFYYRLVGVVLFELTQVRAILFIFPNTFEYFFIFYEAVRSRWSTARMGKWTIILGAAAIWIFIKLPQEWWIHIAQLDMTDFIQETLFGVSAGTSWADTLAARPWMVVAIVAVLLGLILLARWLIHTRAPAYDHGFVFKADPLPAGLEDGEAYRLAKASAPVFDRVLAEKVILLALLSTIFVSMLPGLEAGLVRITVTVGIFVLLNTVVSHWIARRGHGWRATGVEFVVMVGVNAALVVGADLVLRAVSIREGRLPLGATLFFTLLLTLIIVLFDRFHAVRVARLASPPSVPATG